MPKLTSGEYIGAWGLTEHNTGSDAKGMHTTARKEGDEWVLNGTKNFITHGKSGEIAVVIARNGEKGDNHGMTAFVVERGTPGFTAGKKKINWYARRKPLKWSSITAVFPMKIVWVKWRRLYSVHEKASTEDVSQLVHSP